MAELNITSLNFENEVLNSDKPVLLDFYADWCGPCKMLAPVLEHLADDMPNVSFYSIDVDENFPLSHEFGVSSIPCLVVLKHGQEVDRSVGFEPQPAIQAFLEKHL